MANPLDQVRDRIASDQRLREVPAQLWEQLRADPARAPEHLALAAARFHGPAAAEWALAKRRMYAISGEDLAQMAKRKHAALARFGGAATGVGGFVTVLPDLAALAWIQSRLVFFTAAAYGWDPLDPVRPAELLVLQELYDDLPAAQQALDGAGRRVVEAMVSKKLSNDEQLATRLAKMVGKRVGRRMAGRLIPFAAIAFNAVGNERDTRELANRAMAYYRQGAPPPP